MMASDFIVDVTEADFEYQVLAYSQQAPVVVDFWAEWCGPCKILGPMLERLATEAQGGFRLAKVNVDENPNLAMRFNIRSIPTVKAFRDGKVVSEFMGAIPEGRLRDFLRELAPGKDSLMLEKAQSLLKMQQPKSAERAFRQVLVDMPGNTAAQLGLVRSLLFQGKTEEASGLLHTFPASREYNSAELLHPLVAALEKLDQRQTVGGDTDDPLEAAFFNSLRLAEHGNILAAMDGLLDILRQDKHYQNGEVRRVMLALFELLGEDDPMTRQYRNELASVLF